MSRCISLGFQTFPGFYCLSLHYSFFMFWVNELFFLDYNPQPWDVFVYLFFFFFCISFSMTLFLKCPRYNTNFLWRWQGWRNYLVMTGQSKKKKTLILESNIQYKCKSATRNYWDGWETMSLSFMETGLTEICRSHFNIFGGHLYAQILCPYSLSEL